MKGLLYSFVQLYKSLWIACAIMLAVITAGCMVLLRQIDPNELALVSLIVFLMPLVVPVTLSEPINRCIERYISCRFLNYQLCGVTAGKFVLVQLVISFGVIVLGIAAAALTLGGMVLAVSIEGARQIFMFHLICVVAGGTITYFCIPLTIIFRSYEKPGLAVGVAIGTALIYPMMKMLESETIPDIEGFFSEPLNILPVIGICAAVYAVTSLVLYVQVKRGDLC